MTQREKRLRRIQEKRCKNVKFKELCSLVESYGFVLDRTKGSHHIYKYPGSGYEGIVTIPHHGSDVPRPFCWQALEAIEEVIEYHDE
jgi:predicted RNA binding protein YcfA (HicA-like mRNA interferase family)